MAGFENVGVFMREMVWFENSLSLKVWLESSLSLQTQVIFEPNFFP
jgi:hypothetical protein